MMLRLIFKSRNRHLVFFEPLVRLPVKSYSFSTCPTGLTTTLFAKHATAIVGPPNALINPYTGSSNAKSIFSLARKPIIVFTITQICNRLSSTISFELTDFCVVSQDGLIVLRSMSCFPGALYRGCEAS